MVITFHVDYHKVGDEVSKINFDKMKRVADLYFLVGLEIANIEKYMGRDGTLGDTILYKYIR